MFGIRKDIGVKGRGKVGGKKKMGVEEEKEREHDSIIMCRHLAT